MIRHFQVDNVLTVDGDLNFEDVSKLVYLEQCIKESLRVYTVAESTGRLLLRDCEIKGLFIPKGLQIIPCFPDVYRQFLTC